MPKIRKALITAFIALSALAGSAVAVAPAAHAATTTTTHYRGAVTAGPDTHYHALPGRRPAARALRRGPGRMGSRRLRRRSRAGAGEPPASRRAVNDPAGWRKSSHSRANHNCAEVAAWRAPSRSMNGGDCAQVGQSGRAVAVRDSKNPGGPVLVFGTGAWEAFTTGLKHGT